MPTDHLSKLQVKVLSYGIYALIFILTSFTSWQHHKITTLPDTYVRLERYQSDGTFYREALKRIETKLDKIIMDH